LSRLGIEVCCAESFNWRRLGLTHVWLPFVLEPR
jgi:hypothetical protein